MGGRTFVKLLSVKSGKIEMGEGVRKFRKGKATIRFKEKENWKAS